MGRGSRPASLALALSLMISLALLTSMPATRALAAGEAHENALAAAVRAALEADAEARLASGAESDSDSDSGAGAGADPTYAGLRSHVGSTCAGALNPGMVMGSIVPAGKCTPFFLGGPSSYAKASCALKKVTVYSDSTCQTVSGQDDFACQSTGLFPNYDVECATGPLIRVKVFSSATCDANALQSSFLVPVGVCQSAMGPTTYAKVHKFVLGLTPSSLKTVYMLSLYKTLADCQSGASPTMEGTPAALGKCRLFMGSSNGIVFSAYA